MKLINKKEWQLTLDKAYADSQKSAINAYVLSATGETLYDTEGKNSFYDTIENYNDMHTNILQKQVSHNVEQLTSNNQAINLYKNIQNPSEEQLFLLTA